MPYVVTTEHARIALAHREYAQSKAETEAKLEARMLVLRDDPRASDPAAFQKLCADDPECREHVLSLVAWQVWRDGNIESGSVATIEDSGEIRWTLPQFAGTRSDNGGSPCC